MSVTALPCKNGPKLTRRRAYGGAKELTRVTLDPAEMGGKACIRGLRVTVPRRFEPNSQTPYAGKLSPRAGLRHS